MIEDNRSWMELSEVFRNRDFVAHFDFDFANDHDPWMLSMINAYGLYRNAALGSGTRRVCRGSAACSPVRRPPKAISVSQSRCVGTRILGFSFGVSVRTMRATRTHPGLASGVA